MSSATEKREFYFTTASFVHLRWCVFDAVLRRGWIGREAGWGGRGWMGRSGSWLLTVLEVRPLQPRFAGPDCSLTVRPQRVFPLFFQEKNKARLSGCGLLRLFFIPVSYPNHIRLVLEGVLERSGGRFSPSRFVARAKIFVSQGGPAMVSRWPQYGWGKQLGSKSTKAIASGTYFKSDKNHRFRTH